MYSKRTRLYTNFNILNFFQVLKSFLFTKKSFETELQNYLKTKNLKLTSLGRTALYDIVKIIVKEKNKKTFFIAPYTIPAVIHAINYAGGEIQYIDIDKKTGLIDENKLEMAIDNNSAGVIITHLYSNLDNIKNFLNRFQNKIDVIEDAAINFGSSVDGKYLGTLADYGFFSFNVVKNLNTLNGGAIYIKNDNLFKKYINEKKSKKFPIKITLNLLITVFIIKIMFNNFSYQFFHFILKIVYKRKIKFFLKKIYPILYHSYESNLPEIYLYDFNWFLNDVGVYNLKRIENNFKNRLEKAKLYNNLISDRVAIKMNCFSNENALLEYTILLKNINNQTAHKHLMNRGYDIRHTWYINNTRDKENLDSNDFKDTYHLEDKIFCLPLHKNISEKDIKKISTIINGFI
tara:strand:- start:3527 stop:4738 length:1212 start_codon:yes stop_codon:yes gene_type:complete